MYNEAESQDEYVIKFKQATEYSIEENPFHHRMLALVNPYQDPWKTFSERVEQSVSYLSDMV